MRRFENKSDNYFSLNIPGNVALDITYEGYAHASVNYDTQPSLSINAESDRQGTRYPNYTPSSVINSSELQTDDYHWFKFSYKNTGNTILDSEGSGAFNFKPVLYKKTGNGYEETAVEVNYNEKLCDYLYPGEKGDVWVYFGGLGTGEYKVCMYGEVRNEQDTEDWAANYVGGRRLF